MKENPFFKNNIALSYLLQGPSPHRTKCKIEKANREKTYILD